MASQLFSHTEALVQVRHVLATLESVEGQANRYFISFAIKELDIVRLTLLYEYELLDTANIVQEEYLASYFARRVEILQMTREQIRAHNGELEALATRVDDASGQGEIRKGIDIIASALECLTRVVRRLEQEVVERGERHTTH